jgi:glutamyl-tRNA synthetase
MSEVVFQFARADRHREAVDRQLLDAGRAYRCWMTAAELEAAREAARAAGHALRSPWRDRTDGDAVPTLRRALSRAPRTARSSSKTR